MYNQLKSNCVIPTLYSATELHNDYSEINLQLEDLNHEENSDHMEKIDLIIDFLYRYQRVVRLTSRDTLSSASRSQCQTTIEQLNKLVEKFPATSGLVDELQEKLENISIASSSQSKSSVRSNGRQPLAATSPSISPSIQDVRFDHVKQTADSHPSAISRRQNVTFGFNNGPTPPTINTLSSNNVNNTGHYQPELTTVNNLFDQPQQPQRVPSNMPILINQNNSTRIRIKAEEVPKFDGTAGSWPDFKDAVVELIINNVELPTQKSKFCRLMNLLPPLAQDIIRCEKSNPDFQQILNILDEVYGSPALIMNELVQKIQSLPFLRFDSHHSYYTKFYETMVKIKSIDLKDDDSQTIISYVLRRMDYENRRRAFHSLNQSSSNVTITIDQLYEYFKRITQTDLLISYMTNIGINRQTDQRKSLSTTSNDNISTSDDKPKCIFCDQFHFHKYCPLPYDQKISVLNKEKRCYRCAGKGHGTRECTRILKCNKCGSNHQSFLCKGNSRDNQLT